MKSGKGMSSENPRSPSQPRSLPISRCNRYFLGVSLDEDERGGVEPPSKTRTKTSHINSVHPRRKCKRVPRRTGIGAVLSKGVVLVRTRFNTSTFQGAVTSCPVQSLSWKCAFLLACSLYAETLPTLRPAAIVWVNGIKFLHVPLETHVTSA